MIFTCMHVACLTFISPMKFVLKGGAFHTCIINCDIHYLTSADVVVLISMTLYLFNCHADIK